jgi:hypothetical protein
VIQPTEADIGRAVAFRPMLGGWPGMPEPGVVASFNESLVFVRYGDNPTPQGTLREYLTWESARPAAPPK